MSHVHHHLVQRLARRLGCASDHRPDQAYPCWPDPWRTRQRRKVLKTYLSALAAWLIILLLVGAVVAFFYGESQEREWQKILPGHVLHE